MTGLKMCLGKQKVIDVMIANFEISMQLNEMNKIIGDFVGGMNTLSEQMKDITSSIDMVKAQAAYEKAIATNEGLQLDLSFTKLNKANYSQTPCELCSAPGIVHLLHSLAAFCISKRRSRADNFRDTRPSCSAT